MNDFIDHLLARSFGLEAAEDKLQPRTPSLFEARQVDAPLDVPIQEEETPDPDRAFPRIRAPYPDVKAKPPVLEAEISQRGLLLPPEPNPDPADTLPHRESPEPASATAVPSATEKTVRAIVETSETIVQPPEITPSEKPAPAPLLPVQKEPDASRGELAQELSDQSPSPAKMGPEPVQPAPTRLESIAKTTEQKADKAPNIRVHIGRIEVQIPQPTSPSPAVSKAPAAQPRAPFRPPMNLSEYMEKRRSKR